MLPYDYVMSFIISLCPYVWRTAMDPRVEALSSKKKDLEETIEAGAKRTVMIYYIFVIIVVSKLVLISI